MSTYKTLGYVFYALEYISCILEISKARFPYGGFSIGLVGSLFLNLDRFINR